MSSRHKYEYAVDPKADTAPARVIRMVGQGKRVLEIGAGPGSIARQLKEHGGCRVTAVEVDAAAIAKLSQFCEHVYRADLNDPGWHAALADEEPFSVVVIADVLEHLLDPWRMLAEATKLLSENGYIVTSLPHVGHNAIIACLLNEDFDYRDWGLLDKTHIRFFGLKNMQTLFKGAGLSIVDAEFVIRAPSATEFADHWNALSSDVTTALARNRFGLVYQVVINARPCEYAPQSLELAKLPVELPPVSMAVGRAWPIGGGARSVARHLLSPAARDRLRRGLARCGIKV